jgi:hypothetical protein
MGLQRPEPTMIPYGKSSTLLTGKATLHAPMADRT